jgi:Mg2+-importing ATPase
LIIRTGRGTYFGSIAKTIEGSRPKTAFDKGINKFILMMVCFMIFMGVSTLLINGFFKKDWNGAL